MPNWYRYENSIINLDLVYSVTYSEPRDITYFKTTECDYDWEMEGDHTEAILNNGVEQVEQSEIDAELDAAVQEAYENLQRESAERIHEMEDTTESLRADTMNYLHKYCSGLRD